MPTPFEELAALDKLIHEPARLAIMTALSACSAADFTFLQQLTGLTKGNLSSHLQKLEERGLIAIEKRFIGKTPNTQASLTEQGRTAIEQHWQSLDRLRKNAQLIGRLEPQIEL
ncbi:ArsR family transcriptional regulator [Ktedonosporobacter rubrisoli]|uniref:ArsR family transcriptional regulator n=2 Tax=Ktedonosporobacter rubrisoli TaxID=2509675 RepID=A0A4P6K4Z3_KTERU|nr:ArsR family transcriptional regulator [Ktedonosporobacter rubrisoli]